jgi:hypothetical protein
MRLGLCECVCVRECVCEFVLVPVLVLGYDCAVGKRRGRVSRGVDRLLVDLTLASAS